MTWLRLAGKIDVQPILVTRPKRTLTDPGVFHTLIAGLIGVPGLILTFEISLTLAVDVPDTIKTRAYR